MRRAKNWLMTNVLRREKRPMPELPDEVLAMIFNNLSPIERIPLFLVSSRFRSIDLAIGKRRFTTIKIILTVDCDRIDAYCDDLMKHRYSFETTHNGDFENTTLGILGIHQFFKDSASAEFNITMDANSESQLATVVSSIYNVINGCETLYFTCRNSTDFSEFLLTFFKSIRSSRLKHVCFAWKSLRGQNMPRLLEVMQQLPELERIRSIYLSGYDPPEAADGPAEYLLNASLIAPMIKCSVGSSFHVVNCTAPDLLDLFEIVCESKNNFKMVALAVVPSAVDGLFELAEEKGFQIRPNRVMDFIREYAMDISHAYVDNVTNVRRPLVNMYKIAVNGPL